MKARKQIFSLLVCLMLVLSSLSSGLVYAASDGTEGQEDFFHLMIVNGPDTLKYTVETVNDQPVSGEQYTMTGPGTIREIAKAGETFTLRVSSDQYSVSFYGYNNFGVEITELELNYFEFRISDTFAWKTQNLSTYVSCTELKTVRVEECEHGSITTDAAPPFKGGTVTVTVKPDDGYRTANIQYSMDEGKTWKYVENLNNGVGTFATNANTVVKASFVKNELVEIHNYAELQTFAEAVADGDSFSGAEVRLCADITQAWTDPIGTRSTPFCGTFNGDGHTIALAVQGSEILVQGFRNSYAGLFACAYGAVFKNLTTEGTVCNTEDTPNNYTGGMTAYAPECLFENCVNRADLRISQGVVGGIAGYGSSFVRCENDGNLQAQKNYAGNNLGGIAGSCISSIEQCVNYGEITSDKSYTTLTDSKTNVTSTYADADGYAGGLVGRLIQGSRASACTNKGAVRGSFQSAGGVAGQTVSQYGATGEQVTIRDCYNLGEIRMEADGAVKFNDVKLSGILGMTEFKTEILNCYNAGTLSTNPQASGTFYLKEDAYAYNEDLLEISNFYSASDEKTAAKLGEAYIEDTEGVNTSDKKNPLLKWEAEEGQADTKTYTVSFILQPEAAKPVPLTTLTASSAAQVLPFLGTIQSMARLSSTAAP